MWSSSSTTSTRLPLITNATHYTIQHVVRRQCDQCETFVKTVQARSSPGMSVSPSAAPTQYLDGIARSAEAFAQPVLEVAPVGLSQQALVVDEDDEGRRLGRGLGRVLEAEPPATGVAGRRPLQERLPEHTVQLVCSHTHAPLAHHLERGGQHALQALAGERGDRHHGRMRDEAEVRAQLPGPDGGPPV